MCGIAGFLGEPSPKEGVVRAMAAAIAHRGPDEETFFTDASIALGFRRLAIIDLTTGSQPMTLGPLTLIFNGEIYNYKELRAELEAKGHQFKTTSDTEVLLHTLAEYGNEGVARLSGMFGFALWNSETKELLLARDHLGIKPLYWSKTPGSLVFGSEIKSLLAHPSVERVLNTPVLNSYFQYRYVVGEETFFKGINSLPPGHYLTVKEGQEPHITKYWSLPTGPKQEDKGEAYYVEETRRLLTQSVKRMLNADVPVGAYLSGGLDSSIVVALMASLHRSAKDLHTFAVGFEGGESELAEARVVSEMLGTTHHELTLNGEEYFNSINELIKYKDAPLAVPNEIPLWHLSAALRKHITVVLSGEGADELFGGYGRIFRAPFVYRRDKVAEPYQDFVLKQYKYVPDAVVSQLFTTEVSKEIQARGYTDKYFSNVFAATKDLSLEDQTLYMFQTTHLLGLLHKLDTPTMAASVEGRVPFIDKELVEFVHSIPFHYKVRWQDEASEKQAREQKLSQAEISEKYDTPKYLLRATCGDLVPASTVARKKIGFPVPLEEWFKTDAGKQAEKILTEERTRDRKIFNPDFLAKGAPGLSPLGKWMAINFELFMRNYFD